ncbi:MAG: COG4223 family protein [Sphingomicrobium sp.]
MNATQPRLSWSARLLIGLTLILVGAGAAVWALARYDTAARFVGIQPHRPAAAAPVQSMVSKPVMAPQAVQADPVRVAELEQRLARVERASQQAAGSVGRADALVVAFAARRAIDRGVPLGFLETLLIDRFAAQHRQAVATIITSSRTPVKLDELRADYEKLGPDLRGSGPNDGWMAGFRSQLGSLVEIRRADSPSTRPDARYARAASRLASGDVDSALAETMRLPGAARAGDWSSKARRYIAAHRALDEIESSALLVGVSTR